MPYSCALAVCATFCFHIAGALIPIFGPSFPSQCVPLEAPEYGRMIIDRSLIITATEEAEAFRQHYSSFTPISAPRTSFSPQYPESNELSSIASSVLGRRLRLKRTIIHSPYGTSDADRDTNGSESSSGDGYFCSAGTPASMSSTSQRWIQNAVSHSANSCINISPLQTPGAPNPWLSAIPRSTGLPDVNMAATWHSKRRVEEVETDDRGYDGEESCESVTDDKSADGEKPADKDCNKDENLIGGVEKKAAWLLMKLSVKDGERAKGSLQAEKGKIVGEGPRIKRRRATSM